MAKVIFLDIDGTLINSQNLKETMSDVTKSTLNKLKQKGHYLIVASGRCRGLLLKEIKDYPFDGYLLSNGGYFEYNDTFVFKKNFSRIAIRKLIKFCEKYDFVYYLESVDDVYIRDKNHPLHLDFINNWKLPATFIDEYDVDNIECNIAMLNTNSKDGIELAKRELGNYFDVLPHSGYKSCDLNIKNVNKGKAIHEVMNYIKLPIEDTVAFGDGINDLEMLQNSWLGICMGNGDEILKKHADFVTLSVNDEGIYHACLKYGLIEE